MGLSSPNVTSPSEETVEDWRVGGKVHPLWSGDALLRMCSDEGQRLGRLGVRSRKEYTFAERILSGMRHKFGGRIEGPTGG